MAAVASEAGRLTTSGRREFTVQGACAECMGLGWFPANHLSEIQRCDNCAVFESDDAAHAHALALAANVLSGPRRRLGKRMACIVEAVRVAAWEKAGPRRPSSGSTTIERDLRAVAP